MFHSSDLIYSFKAFEDGNIFKFCKRLVCHLFTISSVISFEDGFFRISGRHFFNESFAL